jgi:hypothetical protein
MIGANNLESTLVAIHPEDCAPRTTPLVSAQLARKQLAIFLLLLLWSFVAASDVHDEDPNRRCRGQLVFQFNNPCNAIAFVIR